MTDAITGGESRAVPDPKLDQLSVEYRPVSSLRPYGGNARTHSAKQIKQIAKSIRTFGFSNPILIDKDGMVIAGHGRLEAAKRLGMSEVACCRFG